VLLTAKRRASARALSSPLTNHHSPLTLLRSAALVESILASIVTARRPSAGGAIVISPAWSSPAVEAGEAECRESMSKDPQSGGRLKQPALRSASARALASPITTHCSPLTLFRIAALVALILASIHAAPAQDAVANFDPASTQVTFTLAATLHTVHGVFKLKSGQIHFDPATGKAGGAIVLDATSANTDNDSRDKKMHAEILESAKFPEIVFTPNQVTGPLADLVARKGTVQLQIAGVFRLHGQDHPMTIPVTAAPVSPGATGGPFQASSQFDVPYEKWGLKNPSTFILHVGDTVNVEIHSTVTLSRPTPTR